MRKIASFMLIMLIAAVCIVIPTSEGHAAEAGKDIVYTDASKLENNFDHSGTGAKSDPYRLFEDAFKNVKDGGTIYITNKAFLNDDDTNGPYILDKNVTIKASPGSEGASFSVRRSGLLLKGDVRFENISLDFASKCHDSIFANGHKLELINVSRLAGSRDIDIFAGSLNDSGNADMTSNITIEVNNNAHAVTPGKSDYKFGSIYAGSMNSPYFGSSVINIKENNKMTLGEFYMSGASEAEYDPENLFDLTEPAPPAADPDRYYVSGNTTFNLDNPRGTKSYSGAGTRGKSEINVWTTYEKTLDVNDVDELVLQSGKFVLQNQTLNGDLTVKHDAAAWVNNHAQFSLTGNLKGNGKIITGQFGEIQIKGNVDGVLEFRTELYSKDEVSGPVEADRVYIRASGITSGSGFIYKPHWNDEGYALIMEDRDGGEIWKIDSSGYVPSLWYLGFIEDKYIMLSDEFAADGAVLGFEYADEQSDLKDLNVHINGQEPSQVGMVCKIEDGVLIIKPEEGAEISDNTYEVQLSYNLGNELIETTAILEIKSPTVPEEPVVLAESVNINYKTATLKIGNTIQLSAEVMPENTKDKTVKWTSSDTSTATVSSTGKVTAKGAGKATIKAETADGSGKYAVCTVTVKGTITYVLNGGKNSKYNPTVYVDKGITLKLPTKKGYTFSGWYMDSKYKRRVKAIPSTAKKNYVLYAKWSKVTLGKVYWKSCKNVKTRKVSVYFNKVKYAAGYRVEYSTSSKFTSKRTKKLNTTRTNCTIGKLTKNKTYYIRVKAYKKDSIGSYVYGKSSAVKKIKIKR